MRRKNIAKMVAHFSAKFILIRDFEVESPIHSRDSKLITSDSDSKNELSKKK